jgi:ATP-dependent RNA circularization protein (DNA/RNA ligase family)
MRSYLNASAIRLHEQGVCEILQQIGQKTVRNLMRSIKNLRAGCKAVTQNIQVVLQQQEQMKTLLSSMTSLHRAGE